MNFELDGLHRPVIVVGGGQAGLSMSHCLSTAGVGHLVLERERAGHEWRTRRWDSFCLVTPNWQCRLPGFPYAGGDPDGFMVRDEIVAYLEAYVKEFDVPLHEGVEATRLRQLPGGGFRLTTSAGELTADHVVLATGPYQVPLKPRLAERLPEHVVQLHSAEYRNPAQLPDGEVLVVGTGQSGCQIAEDLHLAGRRVHLAVGAAPRVARHYRGRDVVAWLDEMGYYARGIDEFADADAVRFRANHYVTGRDGGHDIDLRAFATEGMQLYGRLHTIRSGQLSFADDLRRNLDAADTVSEGIKDSIDAFIAQRGIAAPREARYKPVWEPPEGPRTLDVEALSAVVWSTGFGRDHRWIDVPVFDGKGYPTHHRGVTSCPGLYFLGLPWQHTWGSGRFCGVAADAEYLTRRITGVGRGADVRWLSGTPVSTYPADDDWVAPRTVA
ncbi:MSMEG_0569 family flavin-dependent oxidoreductase [Amycolatopsis balhimycina DSM 5908]|uniref:MSMEG_0569 family flavin-dependent oxidoreductase n=1 Tax=Amycolatopsis balhimycina DSM 5908 TaxID=1081091 RepID=A0A428WTN3_AMYBA|nr:MSMEG_0569 family flavin-dependent oxidoreductase [Amycolatopsis balhimycina]RSM46428.1 MSMEG_0569 family flavin-dependent oxidoreductase [Amycolatopsis balhimycina DSM 5908]